MKQIVQRTVAQMFLLVLLFYGSYIMMFSNNTVMQWIGKVFCVTYGFSFICVILCGVMDVVDYRRAESKKK